jgi:hypothetical protein
MAVSLATTTIAEKTVEDIVAQQQRLSAEDTFGKRRVFFDFHGFLKECEADRLILRVEEPNLGTESVADRLSYLTIDPSGLKCIAIRTAEVVGVAVMTFYTVEARPTHKMVSHSRSGLSRVKIENVDDWPSFMA